LIEINKHFIIIEKLSLEDALGPINFASWHHRDR
jgi:hypothetical protein